MDEKELMIEQERLNAEFNAECDRRAEIVDWEGYVAGFFTWMLDDDR